MTKLSELSHRGEDFLLPISALRDVSGLHSFLSSALTGRDNRPFTIDPERFAPAVGRMTQAARQMKVRCGGRVRELLQELFAEHFPGVVEELR